jgi:hypothetical protein
MRSKYLYAPHRPNACERSGAASRVATRARVQRRSSLENLLTLWDAQDESGECRERGCPLAGSVSGQALVRVPVRIQ